MSVPCFLCFFGRWARAVICLSCLFSSGKEKVLVVVLAVDKITNGVYNHTYEQVFICMIERGSLWKENNIN